MPLGAGSVGAALVHAGGRWPAVGQGSHDERSVIDARVLALLDNATLQRQVRELPKVELVSVWRLTQQALNRRGASAARPLAAMDVHRRVVEGLAGESLLVSSSLFLGNLSEVERFFDVSFKTIKARLGQSLDASAGERAVRAARVTMTAADVLGGFDAARAYMHTRNFALGGAAPADLIRTADGERIVLNELHAQAEGGPL